MLDQQTNLYLSSITTSDIICGPLVLFTHSFTVTFIPTLLLQCFSERGEAMEFHKGMDLIQFANVEVIIFEIELS